MTYERWLHPQSFPRDRENVGSLTPFNYLMLFFYLYFFLNPHLMCSLFLLLHKLCIFLFFLTVRCAINTNLKHKCSMRNWKRKYKEKHKENSDTIDIQNGCFISLTNQALCWNESSCSIELAIHLYDETKEATHHALIITRSRQIGHKLKTSIFFSLLFCWRDNDLTDKMETPRTSLSVVLLTSS